ncbi:MAG: RcnB family protein [Alphaproteobacteria bacterium]|nr:RcnB family protein [Alphaproteobacteria bacterium]
MDRSLLLFPALAGLLVAASSAQEFVAPRFEGLEQQQLSVERDRLDTLEQKRATARDLRITPNAPISPARSALRDLEIGREMNSVRLEGEQARALTARQRDIAVASLPNRRISRASVLVVADPVRHALPPAPPGQYYARIDGRFVLVDAMSELVVRVVPVAASDSGADVPAPPLPPAPPPIARGRPD